MERILEYLKKTYHPNSILLYGSYADGTNDETSDFDCMLIVSKKDKNHDDAVIDGIQLDCFIFTEDELQSEDINTFLTAYNSNIVLDNGIGADLKRRVHEYVEKHADTPKEEKDFLISWIQKTVARITKNDDEGNMRAVSFLAESLADYYILRDIFYFGSKKAIQYLKKEDAEGYAFFHDAVTLKSNASIIKWAEYVIKLS
ncbi:MAG: nucleotidyltransferase domain-containing protein [Acutalibacter sp.]|nr:nucleotidyltransferase domain-containing protein [Acutalibacter sp.]